MNGAYKLNSQDRLTGEKASKFSLILLLMLMVLHRNKVKTPKRWLDFRVYIPQ